MTGIQTTGINTLFMLICWICFMFQGDTMRCYFNHETHGYNFSCKSPTSSEMMQAMERVNIFGTDNLMSIDERKIIKLPEEIFKFYKLSGITELSLTNNFVTELPGGLFNNSGLVHLKKLLLSYNKITYLKPDQFISLQNLKFLDLDHNQIDSVEPDTFTGLLNLEELIMKNNKITDLKDNQFMSLSRLRLLYLGYNRIQNMEPTVFTGLLNLQSLCLKHNKITHLKLNQFMFLPKLRSVILNNNEIQNVEPGAFTIHSSLLQFINLNFNSITVLPDDLFQGKTLTQLHRIFLQNNNISMIPKCVFTSSLLPNLKVIRLGGNNIQIITSTHDFSLPKLKALSLDRNNLTSIPADMFDSNNWTALSTLILKSNRLSYLPSNVFSSTYLVNLKFICISGNSLTLLPDGLFNNPVLQKLKHLDFSYNIISVLPENLFNCSNLRNLEILLLLGNKIELLPDKLFQNKFLQKLKIIDLRSNKINFIPSGFFKYLKNISHLNIAHNQIKHLSADMFPNTLKHLKRLFLSHNCISSIKEIIPLGITYRKKPPWIYADHNNLSIQVVNFNGKYGTKIPPKVDINLGFNNINSFEMFSNTRDAVYQYKVLRYSRFYVAANKNFRVGNLVKASLGIDLNNINWLDLPSTFKSDGFIRLSSLIKNFRYKYICDCKMLMYLKMQEKINFFLIFFLVL